MKDWKPEEIAQFRETHKMTRKALGRIVGVTVSTIYQWERGLKKPSKMAKILLLRIEQERAIEGGAKRGKGQT
jgi:DNA-binding transcriptional regulator YiaG